MPHLSQEQYDALSQGPEQVEVSDEEYTQLRERKLAEAGSAEEVARIANEWPPLQERLAQEERARESVRGQRPEDVMKHPVYLQEIHDAKSKEEILEVQRKWLGAVNG